MSGMVSVPSFHTAGAILLAWAFRRVPLLGLGFIALDIGIILTAPMIGSHYFIDIFSGLATGVIAIALAHSIARSELSARASPVQREVLSTRRTTAAA